MREIKFRAWDQQGQQMYEVSSLNYEESEIRVWDTPKMTSPLPWDERIIVMQFTGLKDKTGRRFTGGTSCGEVPHVLEELPPALRC